jgi:hypothetical protein
MMQTDAGSGHLAEAPAASKAAAVKGDRRKFWATHIEAWSQSGLTQVDYCRRHGLRWSNFHYWRKRLNGLPAPAALVELPVSSIIDGQATRDPNGLVLIFDRYRVEIADGFNPAALARLIQVLGHL